MTASAGMTGQAHELDVGSLVRAAYAAAPGAARAAAPWLMGLILAGGLYSVSLNTAAAALSLLAALAVFLTGIEASRAAYGHLLGKTDVRRWPLIHANSSVYGAYMFMVLFTLLPLALLQGVLIELKGTYDLGANASPDEIRAAITDLMGSAWGSILTLAALGALAVMCVIALRILTYGAATADKGAAYIFRSAGWTRGRVVPLALASVATHVAPFALGVAANFGLVQLLPQTDLGLFLRGACGVALMVPFLMSGHAMAVAAYRRLGCEGASQNRD